ncbi:hypothetical protein [Hymenobacter agri]
MGTQWKLILPVPEDNGIDYLVMEDDSSGTGGFYVYYLSSTNPDIGFDDWYEKAEYARNVAAEYGLSNDDWQLIESEN